MAGVFQASQSRRTWDRACAGGSALAAIAQGFVLGGFFKGVRMQDGAFADVTFDFFGVLGALCGAGLIGGYALLGAGCLVWETRGGTEVFGRDIGRAALLLTAVMMALVSGWSALTQPEVAVRWFAWPRVIPQALLPLGALCTTIALWRSFRGRCDGLPFLLGIVLFLLGFGGVAVSLFPHVVPWQFTIWTGAADISSLRFVAAGMVVILPIIVAYLGHAYRVFRGKAGCGGYGSNPTLGVTSRSAGSLDNDLHLS